MSAAAGLSCSQYQSQLSLYLYGELDFAAEETLEEHLEACPLCQLALAREKLWHATVNRESFSIPGSLLADCRRELSDVIRVEAVKASAARTHWRMPEWLRVNFTHLSGRFALASFCLFAGMAIAHWGARLMGPSGSDTALQMDVLGSPTTRVRDIQPAENGRVRIIVDRSQQQELVGAASDGDIRIMLLAAARNSADPGLRIDSVDLLRQQRGDDIREVLLSAVRHDENAAVRLKALDALRAFPADQTIRQALVSVLQHDGDPGVRAEAINVLLPPDQPAAVTPDLLRILQAISVSGHSDDYLRSRSVQVLRASGSPDVY